jgi:hypothetical protein
MAVLLLNREAEKAKNIEISLKELGLKGKYKMVDVFIH